VVIDDGYTNVAVARDELEGLITDFVDSSPRKLSKGLSEPPVRSVR
jgi:hypothetical protein